MALFGVAAPSWANDYLYTVRPGDTLWDLSDKYMKRGVAATRRLQELNRVDDPEHLQPGSKLRFPIRWMKVQPAPVTIKLVSGESYALVGEAQDQRPLQAGQTLNVGDAVVTGPGGNVVLEFADGSRMILRGDSRVTFDTLSAYGDTGMADTRARLQRGRVDADAEPSRGPGSRYEIHTPAAASAVRGTNYRVSAEAAAAPVTRVEVLDGTVSVSAAGRARNVPQAFGVRAKQGNPPDPPRRLLPKPDTSALPPVLERLPVVFQWPALAGATAYRIQIGSGAGLDTLLVDQTVSDARVERLQLAQDGQYSLRVRGIDQAGLEGLDAVHGFVLNARPEPPASIHPTPEELLRDPRPELRWTTPEEAAGYRLQLADNPDFAPTLVDSESTDRTSFRPAAGLAPGTYYWRLATRDGSAELGPFGDAQSFTYQPPPPSPKSELPQVTQDAISVRWSAAEPGQRYRVQFARDSEFKELVVDEQVADPEYSLLAPAAGSYYLRVATVAADGYLGPFSTTQRIDIPYRHWWRTVLILLGGALLLL